MLSWFGFHKDYFLDEDGWNVWRRYGPKWSCDIEFRWPPISIRVYRSLK